MLHVDCFFGPLISDWVLGGLLLFDYFNKPVPNGIRKSKFNLGSLAWGFCLYILACNPFKCIHAFKIKHNFYYKNINCRALGPRSSLSTCILGLWPKSRTMICPRRRSLRQKRLCWWTKRLALVIMAQESGLRMNKSSARQSRGLKRWSINKGDDPRNLVRADKHCRDIR